MLNDTTGSRGFRTLDRRTLLRTGAWAAPVLVLATAAPAAAASAVNPVITGAFSFFPGGVGGNVFVKYEGGEWQANNLIQVTIASADGVLGTPTTQELGGWNALALLAGSATLQYPVAPPSDDWTAPNLWIPFTAPPTAASVSINGQILGTTATGFEPGAIVGPP